MYSFGFLIQEWHWLLKMWLQFLCIKSIIILFFVINPWIVFEWIAAVFPKTFAKWSARKSVFEAATVPLAVWLAAALGELNYRLRCRERQALNGNVRSFVFAPTILFNGREIWAAGSVGFVPRGHKVCARDVWKCALVMLEAASQLPSFSIETAPMAVQEGW